jgi:hypothetical protein
VGPLIGPVIAMLSFVCSVGNVPLAAVLWNGGMSFGGIVSFIFADLIILPILRIKQKYYGTRVAAIIGGAYFAAMAVAGYLVEGIFALLRLTPDDRNAKVLHAGVTWNYTTVLNIVFLVVAVALIVRFLRTGGPQMLRMMNDPHAAHDHDHGHDHGHGHAHDHSAHAQQRHSAQASPVGVTSRRRRTSGSPPARRVRGCGRAARGRRCSANRSRSPSCRGAAGARDPPSRLPGCPDGCAR